MAALADGGACCVGSLEAGAPPGACCKGPVRGGARGAATLADGAAELGGRFGGKSLCRFPLDTVSSGSPFSVSESNLLCSDPGREVEKEGHHQSDQQPLCFFSRN